MSYTQEELNEHFLLNKAEKELVKQCRGEVNQHGVAVLLKSLLYLGYFPEQIEAVPLVVRTFIARQLNLQWDPSASYLWDARTRGNHFALIRRYTGFRFPTERDKQELGQWLRTEASVHAYTIEDLTEGAFERLRLLHIECPADDYVDERTKVHDS